MALSNYTDLQTAITSWLHRSDLSTQVPDFIDLAEGRINQLLHVRAMEAEDALSVSIGSNSAALPSRFVEEIACFITLNGAPIQLVQVDASEISASTANGMPQYWAVDGENVRFGCPLDALYTVTLRYKKGFDLSATSTNWLMTKYPRAYLYGAQVEAAIYMRDQAALATSEQAFQKTIDEINANSKVDVPLRVDGGIANYGAW